MGRWGDGKPLSWGRLPPLREVAQPEGGDREIGRKYLNTYYSKLLTPNS